jgi:hypothetical protein
MDTITQPTRVWWDGEEVRFVGWTEKALVFHWEDPRETAIHMPRGAVVRLMDKGVLRIEGYVPVWMCSTGQPSTAPAAPAPAPPVEVSKPPQLNTRLSAVARLIRKLSGDRAPERARATGS